MKFVINSLSLLLIDIDIESNHMNALDIYMCLKETLQSSYTNNSNRSNNIRTLMNFMSGGNNNNDQPTK